MAIIDSLLAQRQDAGKLYTSGTGTKIAGEGKFKVVLTTAKCEKNRSGDADTLKLEYKVVDVLEGNPEDIGRTFTEYVSSKTKEDLLSTKIAVLLDQLLRGGAKQDKLSDDDDETLFDAGRTMVGYAAKFVAKHPDAVVAYVTRKESNKTAENGKPYYNNYWEAYPDEEAEVPAEAPKETKAPKAKKAVEGKSPYAADDDED